MKLYIAASWTRRLEMRKIAKQLEKLGIEVTSRWLYEHQGMDPFFAATQDLKDIDNSDALLFFSETSDAGYLTGGRHFEMGYAFSQKKPIYVIGDPENVFHTLGYIFHFPTFKKFKAAIAVEM